MRFSIALDYTLPEGGMAPYFDALRAGVALASRCKGCGRISFPPRLVCAECGAEAHDWVRLSGRARVVLRTDALAAAFALARFEGADGTTTVALGNPEARGETGQLMAPNGPRPGLWLRLNERETDHA